MVDGASPYPLPGEPGVQQVEILRGEVLEEHRPELVVGDQMGLRPVTVVLKRPLRDGAQGLQGVEPAREVDAERLLSTAAPPALVQVPLADGAFVKGYLGGLAVGDLPPAPCRCRSFTGT